MYTHSFINLFLWVFFSFFFAFATLQHVGLVPLPDVERAFPEVEVWNFNHWTAMQVPHILFSNMIYHRIMNIVHSALQWELLNLFHVL